MSIAPAGNEKISALNPATALTGPEKMASVQGGNTVYITPDQIADFVGDPAQIGPQITAWFLTLPTTLPASANVLWNNGGTLALS